MPEILMSAIKATICRIHLIAANRFDRRRRLSGSPVSQISCGIACVIAQEAIGEDDEGVAAKSSIIYKMMTMYLKSIKSLPAANNVLSSTPSIIRGTLTGQKYFRQDFHHMIFLAFLC